MNHLEQFGLTAEPFSNSHSTRIFYKSASHGKALLRLMTAADADGGIFSLLGAPGTGKSLLLRRLLESLSEESTRAALVPVPLGGLNEAELSSALSFQLRIEQPAASIKALSKSVDAGDGRRVLIIIDDADRLDPALLKALAAMKSASLIFTGPKTAAFSGGDSLELTPLNGDGTDAFIRLRLKTAGRVQELFSPEARKRVHQVSQGIPARINTICEQALIGSALAGADKVDDAAVLMAGLVAGCASIDGAPREPLAMSMSAPANLTAVSSIIKDDVLSRLADDDDTFGGAGAESTVSSQAADTTTGSLLDDLVAEENNTEPSAAQVGDDEDELGSMLDDFSNDDEPQPAPVAAKKAKAVPASEPENDDLDSMLSDLAADDEPAPAPVAVRKAKPAPPAPADNDLDSMLNDLAADDEPAPMPVAAKKSKPAPTPAPADDDLDSMLNDLAADDEPAPAPVAAKKGKPAPAPSVDDDLDSMLNDLAADDEPAPTPVAAKKAKPAPAPSADDDLDSMLNDLAGDDEPAPVATKKAKVAPAPKADTDDDLDAMLSDMGGDEAGTEADLSGESLDDMLGSLDQEMAVGKAASSDDDLDSLLSGLDDEAPPPPVKKAAPQAKAAPAKKPAPVPDAGDELDDMLGALEMDTQSKKPDSLENELDSLLEGLDD